MESSKTSGVLKWGLAIALVIVINLFFYYAIALVYPEPKFEKFCSPSPVAYVDATSCVQNGGQWSQYPLSPKEVTTAVKENQPLGYCDPNFTCQNNYNDAHSVYNRNVFGILIVLGIAILVAGVFISIEALSLGLVWGGILALIIASIRYWSDASNWMRVVILVIALIALI